MKQSPQNWINGNTFVGPAESSYTYRYIPGKNPLMEVEYAIICDKVVQEILTEKPTAVGIMNGTTIEITSESAFLIMALEVLVRIKNARGAISANVEITKPDETQAASIALNGENTDQDLTLIARFSAVKFDVNGWFGLRVTVNNDLVTFLPKVIEIRGLTESH